MRPNENIYLCRLINCLTMRLSHLLTPLIVLTVCSCSGYQRLLKSGEPEEKYKRAVEYFDKKDYMRAQTLLSDVSAYYKGTEESQDVLRYLCESYEGMKDYDNAIDYYKTYIRSFPRGKYVQLAKYKIGYCYYKQSPDARLDQTMTKQAVSSLQEFIDVYPESQYVPEANRLLDELFNKLAYKELLNARLYRNLGTYRGDNYQSAIIAANNALKKYPTSDSREELMFIILQARYEQARASMEELQHERYESAFDEYYSYVNEYPEGRFKKQADKIKAELDAILKK